MNINKIFSLVIIVGFAFLLFGMPVAVSASPSTTEILYVTPAGTGDCSSWANACGLQTALTTAVSDNEIWVAAGTYKPTTGTDRNATFQLVSGVAVYGGFNGTETALSERNPATNLTILSGDIDNNDSQTPIITNARTVSSNSTNSFHVVTGANGALLDGLTITAGTANGGADAGFGGGMLNEYSSPTLTNVTFSGNYSSVGGGMSDWYGSNPTLTNVTFNGNAGNYCAGMFNYSSNPTLTNVTFSNNSADFGGGGMFNQYNSNPTLTNVTFSGNGVQIYGGGMFNEDNSNPTLTNVTFSGNYASAGWRNAGIGGGMYNDPSSSPQIRDTIFWNNTAFLDGAQIYNEAGSNSIINDSVVQGGCPTGSTCTNIITADPILGTLGNYGGLTQTIPLLAGSSAIDAGNNNTCAKTDQRGITRPQGPHCDIGAFEYEQHIPPVVSIQFTPNGSNGWFTTSPATGTVTATDAQTGNDTIKSIDCTGTVQLLNVSGYGTHSATGTLSVTAQGTTKISCTATDSSKNVSAPVSATVNLDSTPPTCTASANPSNIWPPNNKLVKVNVTVTPTDTISGLSANPFNLISVTSNENITSSDYPGFTTGTAATSGQLMARRDGNNRDGRIYSFTYQVKNNAGLTNTCQTTVTVPHNK